jgi:hypothetical protein
VDWQGYEQEADILGVAPVVTHVLVKHASDLAPLEALRRCKHRLTRVAKKNLLWLQQWQHLLQLFDEAALPVISFKGPALGLTAYGNLNLREFSDLDLLIRSRDVARGSEILRKAGYTLWSPTLGRTDGDLLRSNNRQLRFTGHADGAAVDLHWGLVHEMFPFQIGVHQVFAAANLEQHPEASFLSLSPEHLLLYLCAQGTKKCWSNLSHLCDVAAHINAHPRIDWNACLQIAEASGCDLLLQHTLLLTERVLEVELPITAKRYCRQDETAVALSHTAERFMFAVPSSRPGYWRALTYHLAFAGTWRTRAKLVFTRLLAPAEPDWQSVSLPRPLFFLYYLVRPLRFLQEQVSRSVHALRNN